MRYVALLERGSLKSAAIRRMRIALVHRGCSRRPADLLQADLDDENGAEHRPGPRPSRVPGANGLARTGAGRQPRAAERLPAAFGAGEARAMKRRNAPGGFRPDDGRYNSIRVASTPADVTRSRTLIDWISLGS